MDTLQVVWARYTGAFLLALADLQSVSPARLMRTKRPVLQLGRSVLLLGSTMLNFVALRYLQLDEALAIVFSTPFFVAVAVGADARRMGRLAALDRDLRRLLSACCWSTRPGVGGIHPAALLSLVGSAFCYALYIISTRILVAHRFQRDHAVLFQSGRRGRHAAGAAVRLDHAGRSAGHRADGGCSAPSAASAITS